MDKGTGGVNLDKSCTFFVLNSIFCHVINSLTVKVSLKKMKKKIQKFFLLIHRQRKLTGSVEALSNATDPNSENPEFLAESCLREIFSRASFGNISAALEPIFV